MARESAFFALFLGCESGQFAWYMRNNEMRKLSLFNVCVSEHQHKQWSVTVSVILIYHGSPDPTTRNKDKIGRLRSVYHSITPSFEPWAQKKSNKNGKRRKQRSSGKKRVLQGSHEKGSSTVCNRINWAFNPCIVQ